MRVRFFSDGDMEDLADFCDTNYIEYEILYHEASNGIVAHLNTDDVEAEVLSDLEHFIMSKGEVVT